MRWCCILTLSLHLKLIQCADPLRLGCSRAPRAGRLHPPERTGARAGAVQRGSPRAVFISVYGIPTMRKPAPHVRLRRCCERVFDRVAQIGRAHV